MKKDLLDEIIQLKEEKKILEVACGDTQIDRHIFSHAEEMRIRELRSNDRSRDMLRDVERRIQEDENSLKNWTE